jgi:hypothetical protein
MPARLKETNPMLRQEWLTSQNARTMVRSRRGLSPRKKRLMAAACVAGCGLPMNDDHKAAISLAVQMADLKEPKFLMGVTNLKALLVNDWHDLHRKCPELQDDGDYNELSLYSDCVSLLNEDADSAIDNVLCEPDVGEVPPHAADAVREALHPPLVTWKCPACHAANAVVEWRNLWRCRNCGDIQPGLGEDTPACEYDLHELPVLADYLEDHGFVCEDVLEHLRKARHSPGCWALDMVLGLD